MCSASTAFSIFVTFVSSIISQNWLAFSASLLNLLEVVIKIDVSAKHISSTDICGKCPVIPHLYLSYHASYAAASLIDLCGGLCDKLSETAPYYLHFPNLIASNFRVLNTARFKWKAFGE